MRAIAFSVIIGAYVVASAIRPGVQPTAFDSMLLIGSVFGFILCMIGGF